MTDIFDFSGHRARNALLIAAVAIVMGFVVYGVIEHLKTEVPRQKLSDLLATYEKEATDAPDEKRRHVGSVVTELKDRSVADLTLLHNLPDLCETRVHCHSLGLNDVQSIVAAIKEARAAEESWTEERERHADDGHISCGIDCRSTQLVCEDELIELQPLAVVALAVEAYLTA
jgi:hypothetical protein